MNMDTPPSFSATFTKKTTYEEGSILEASSNGANSSILDLITIEKGDKIENGGVNSLKVYIFTL